MSLRPNSIRGRMLVLSAGATLIGLMVAGFMMAAILSRVVTQGVDRRLDSQIALLATAVGSDGRIDDARLASVRGALEAGPGWRWQIATPSRTTGSRDFPQLDDAPPHRRGDRRDREDGPRPRDGRDADGNPAHGREVTLSTSSGKVVLSAAAPREVIERPIRDALFPLLLVLALLSLVLAGAALGQVWYGLRPLRQLRDAVAAIRAGRAAEIPADQPTELRPLSDELNALTKDNYEALAIARASAANLAHALKTPVATLALELRDDPERARQVARIEATIRHHLSRARERVIDRRARTIVAPAVADLIDTVSRLTADRPLSIAADIEPGITVAVEPADFDEMIGNLLDNAVRHGRSQVVIHATLGTSFARVAVEDDGPGIPVDAQFRAVQPGVRLDERGSGHGFGLAIARELSELYGGTLELGVSSSGGLLAAVTMPVDRRQILAV
jgi:signal transduction histidine kinase